MLYNENGGKIFTGADNIEAALEDGWAKEPLPPDKLAQGPVDPTVELRAQNQELNAALETMHADLTEARKLAASERGRADAATTRLAAALKKAKDSAGK